MNELYDLKIFVGDDMILGFRALPYEEIIIRIRLAKKIYYYVCRECKHPPLNLRFEVE